MQSICDMIKGYVELPLNMFIPEGLREYFLFPIEFVFDFYAILNEDFFFWMIEALAVFYTTVGPMIFLSLFVIIVYDTYANPDFWKLVWKTKDTAQEITFGQVSKQFTNYLPAFITGGKSND